MNIDAGLTVWTMLTFGCLLLALARLVYRPLRTLLEQREAAIRDSLEKAEQAREGAQQVLAQNEEELARARDEVRQILNDGHRIVSEMKRESQDSAHREAEHVVAQAREEINRQVQRSMDELKATVANLSVRIARQVIQEGLDEKRHMELADTFIDRLKKSHAQHRS